ncbi:MAG TPA: restriction endonuclease subunit S [Edaphobacter sp.]|uniref:restriction endonuclease subunit S n=1 Tax=Edaphobacter sp. TaxID=1934404 RepID=UPI002C95B353|nr:restriction endonuclease subunit S [Edaphobacter sp.]HUZ97258.1 restriction endonuclease subunit S [Edaphobacter sp.]
MQAKPYPRYRPSGVGWLGDVPVHWEVKRGRFCMDVNPRSNRLWTLEPEAEVSFIPMDAVGEYGGLDLEQVRAISEVDSGYTEFDDGDVVVAKITPCFENGKGALAVGLVNGAAFGTTELHVLRATTALDRRILFYFTLSWPFRSTGEGEMYGAGGQKRVPPEFCKNVRVPLPPPDEQCMIAHFLDRETAKIDALVTKKRTLVERLKEKRTALISRTVTKGLPPDAARAAGLNPYPKLKPSGIDWLGDVPEHWNTWKATHGFRRIGSGTTPKSDDADYYDGDIPWVTTSELRESVIMDTATKVTAAAIRDYPTLRLYPKATLLFAMYGATIGRLGILGIPATVNQACAAFADPLYLDTQFVYYWFQMRRPTLIALSAGGGQPNLSQDDLRQVRIPAPPLGEQRVIADFLDHETAKIDQMAAKVEATIDRLQEYRTAIITAAMTGKIDVRTRAARPTIPNRV